MLAGGRSCIRFLQTNLSLAAHTNCVRPYPLILLFEWLLFALVMAGVRRSRTSVLIVLGDHWHSVRQVLRDIGIAIGFWIVAAGLLWFFGWLLRIHENGGAMAAMLPHGGVELTSWIALSVTAGICEETIFRGYLQRQFITLTKSAPAPAFSFLPQYSARVMRTRASV